MLLLLCLSLSLRTEFLQQGLSSLRRELIIAESDTDRASGKLETVHLLKCFFSFIRLVKPMSG